MEPTKQKQPIDIKIREAAESDIPFIFNSWLNSFRNGSFSHGVPNQVYFAEQHKLIEKLLKRSTVLIACDTKDPTIILGYACFEQVEGVFTIHYMYTKHLFRSLGVGRALSAKMEHDFNNAGVYTHNTKSAERLAMKFNMVYHPYILLNYDKKD